MLSSVLALLASLLWGSSFFSAGILSRRTSLWAVVAFAQLGGLTAAFVLVLAHGQPVPAPAGVAISALTGVSGFIAIVSMYKALSIGVMSLVTPISATGIVVPIVVGLAGGDRPSTSQAIGMALALVGIVFASLEPSEPQREPLREPTHAGSPAMTSDETLGLAEIEARATGPLASEFRSGGSPILAVAVSAGPVSHLRDVLLARLSIALALVAALTIGLSYVGLAEAARYDAYWCVFIMRGTSLPFVLVTLAVTRPALNLKARLVPAMLVTGAAEVVGNALFALATTGALLVLVSVLGYLFPVVTIILACVFLRERLTKLQWIGAGAALVGALFMVT